MFDSDEHERTMAFANIALGRIKALRQSAEPRNYEVWYHYATGYNPSLNQTIDETLARKGTLASSDLDDIRQAYISANRLTQQLDRFGAQVAGEIEAVMAMIDSAVGTTGHYSENLADASQQLGRAKDREALRVIVEGLISATRGMEHTNRQLETKLRSTRHEIQELQAHLEAVRHENLTDPLTSLANRKYFDEALQKAITEALAEHQPMSLSMLDIDNFKGFNDSYGHLTGDQVLRLVAMAVKQTIKGRDLAARYGGEEFALVLPATALPEAVVVSEHVRRAVMGKELMKRSTRESLGRVTVSIGVATLRPGDTPQSLIERADACLYAAKRGGRNRVFCETDGAREKVLAAQVA